MRASHRNAVALVTALLTLGFGVRAVAATEPAAPPEPAPHTLPWKPGAPATPIGDDLAEIDLGEGQIYLDAAGTGQFLEMTQNPANGTELAVITPASDHEQWFVIFEWSGIGYVKDDEAAELDPDAMLESIRDATAAGNEEREKRGWAPMEIVGWQEAPHYDTRTNHLTWAIIGASEGHRSINRMVKLLGRKGVMTVTLVSAPEEITAASARVDELLGAYRFRPGNTYAEFLPGKDTVAEMGLKGLILGGAGAVLLKSGLLGKFWKGIVVAIVALGAGVARLLGRKKDTSVGPTPT